MPVNLTPNAIAAINGGDVNSKPLVQVLDIKLIGSTQDRYRLLVSDSVLSQHAMLATQLNEQVKTAKVRKGSVVQLIDYICTTVQNRKMIIVLNMETIIPECEIIGNPKVFSESNMAAPRTFASTNVGNIERISNNSISARNQVQNMQTLPSRNQLPQQSHSDQNGQSFRPAVQPPYQPPPKYKNHGAMMRNEAPARIIPISALNPYQGRWAIRARVTSKGDLRRYNNSRGDGKVFSFDLLDSDGGEIRVTCFNAVVDRFYDVIEGGKVYLISKGSLKPAQKNFNHLKNEWEIFLEATSTVDLCQDEDASIPQQQFSFTPINDIENAENNTILDVIGIVTSVNPSVLILRKNGMETQRRVLNLRDGSGRSVEVTMWGEVCNREGQKLQELIDSGLSPLLAIKASKVSDFSGKSLGTISSSQLFIDPDIPEAQSLRNWFHHEGKNTAPQSISREFVPGGSSSNDIRKTVSQIKDEGLGRSDKPDWVTIKGTLTFIKTEPFCYRACPLMIGDRQCNKKVTRSNNRWICDRCNQEFEECDYRYLLQAQIQDHTGVSWITAFQETGEEIMGCSAKELFAMKEEDEARFAGILQAALFTEYMFRFKIKEDSYGDEQRVKITVVKVDKVDYSSDSRNMLDLLPNMFR